MELIKQAEPTMTYDGEVEIWTWKDKTVRIDAGASDEDMARILLEACGFKPL